MKVEIAEMSRVITTLRMDILSKGGVRWAVPTVALESSILNLNTSAWQTAAKWTRPPYLSDVLTQMLATTALSSNLRSMRRCVSEVYFRCAVLSLTVNQSFLPPPTSSRSVLPTPTQRRKRRNETSDFFYDYNEGLFVWDEECACSEGYYGKLCQSCSEGYGKATTTGITECKKCPSKGTNIMLVAVMMIVGIAAVSYIVYRKSKKYKASIVRIGLTFMQFQLYASFVHIEWPIQMRTLFTMQETIASATPSWVSFDCFTIALGIVKPPPERKVCYTNTTDWQRNVSFGQGNATFGQGDATVEQQSIPNVVDVSVSPALAQTRYQVLGIPTLLLGIVFCFFCCRYVYLHLTNGKKGDVVKKNDDGTFDVKFDRDGSRKSNVEVRLIVPIGRSKVVAPGERAIIYKDFEKKWKSNIIRTLMIVEWMIWGQAVKSTLNLVKCTTYDVARLDLVSRGLWQV